ncbi:YceD family protein [Achromobacter aloeverae]
MKKQPAGIIDAFEFVRLGKQAEGSVPLARMLRAVEGLPEQPDDASGEVHWQLRGLRGAMDEPLLELRVQASPVLICQRCMEPFAFPIDAEVLLQLVRNESELDDGGYDGRDDEDEEEDGEPGSGAAAPEKVVGSQRFDVLSQVEDELILNIPYVPRHEVCPGAAGQAGQEKSEPVKRPSPFAVLEKLKHKD